jgi:hypothetical protein
MKLIAALIAISVCLVTQLMASNPSPNWNSLAKGGKGVALTKVRQDGVDYFIFFVGTNSKQLSSQLIKNGIRFDSITKTTAFIKQRPAGVTLFPAALDLIDDDLKVWRPFSAEEREALSAAMKAQGQRE